MRRHLRAQFPRLPTNDSRYRKRPGTATSAAAHPKVQDTTHHRASSTTHWLMTWTSPGQNGVANALVAAAVVAFALSMVVVSVRVCPNNSALRTPLTSGNTLRIPSVVITAPRQLPAQVSPHRRALQVASEARCVVAFLLATYVKHCTSTLVQDGKGRH